MKTAELTGAHLDYWCARAEGVLPEQLEIRQVQRGTDYHCVLVAPRMDGAATAVGVMDYSTRWAMGGPLMLKHQVECRSYSLDNWHARCPMKFSGYVQGGTPLEAICRAVVRAAFGDEVEDVPCA